MSTPKPKTEKRSVKHVFTLEETAALHVLFTNAYDNRNAVMAESKSVKDSYKAKETEAESRMASLNAAIRAGCEMREKVCVIIMDFKAGKKFYYLETDIDEKGKAKKGCEPVNGRSAVQVALLSEYSVNSSSFNNALGKLRTLAFITREQPIRITQSGIEALGPFNPLPTGIELAKHWIGKFGKCEASILTFLVDNHPNSYQAAEVADAVGYSNTSSSFNNALGRLRTLELITRGQPMKATDEFFQ